MMKIALGIRWAKVSRGTRRWKPARRKAHKYARMPNNLRAIYHVMLTSQIKKKRRYCYRQFPYSTTRIFRAW
jgi:hypothetical protein